MEPPPVSFLSPHSLSPPYGYFLPPYSLLEREEGERKGKRRRKGRGRGQGGPKGARGASFAIYLQN